MAAPPDIATLEKSQQSRVIWAQNGLGLAECASLCIALWRGAVTDELLARQRAALESVVSAHPTCAGFVTIVEPSSPPPNQEQRRVAVEMVTRYGSRLACLACVIEGDGFAGAVARSVLAGMALLLPNSTAPVKFFGSAAAAAPWISTRCPSASVPAFLQCHDTLKRQLNQAQE